MMDYATSDWVREAFENHKYWGGRPISILYEVSFLMKFHLQLNLDIYKYVQIEYDLINLSLETLWYGTLYWWGCGTIIHIG